MHQPHAALVGLGVKRIETRPCKPPGSMVGVTIAVHANKSEDYAWLAKLEVFSKYVGTGLGPLDVSAVRGAIIATVEIVRHQLITPDFARALRSVKPEEFEFGDYTSGRYAWMLRGARMLAKPIPFRAHQGWPDVDDALIAEVAL